MALIPHNGGSILDPGRSYVPEQSARVPQLLSLCQTFRVAATDSHIVAFEAHVLGARAPQQVRNQL